MTRTSKLFVSGIVAIALTVAVFVFLQAPIVKAAQNVFAPTNCYTAAATSTLTYMTSAGVATSTVACAQPDGFRSAVVAIQVNASSTAAAWNVNVEQSMDGVDWYPINNNYVSSTTNPFNLGIRGSANFVFASTTQQSGGGTLGVDGTNNRSMYVLQVPVEMKRVRVHVTLTAGVGGVWAQIIPRKDLD